MKVFSKHAALEDEAAQIILAVLVILLFVYLIFSIYKLNVNNEERKIIYTLDSLEAKIDNAPLGGNIHIVLGGLENWMFVVWSKSDGSRPDKCYFKSCICICDASKPINDPQSSASRYSFYLPSVLDSKSEL